MDQFKGTMDAPKKVNEHEKKEFTKIDAKVKVKKPSKALSLFRIFFSKDIFSAIKDAFLEVTVPNIRDNAAKTGKNVIDQMFYDTPSKGRGGYNSIDYSGGYHTSYSAITRSDNNKPKPQRRSVYEVNNVVFYNVGEVKDVILQLQDICRRYGYVTVLDFYDVINQPQMSHLDDRYGWTNLEGLDWNRTSEGYVIDFPKVQVIEDK